MRNNTDQHMSPESFDDVVKVATEVFGHKETAIKWLHQESIALGNKTPISLLDNSSGKSLVLCELRRIEHGIVS